MKGKVTKLLLTSLLIAGTVVTATPSLSDVHALTGPEYDLIELQRNRLIQNGDFEKGTANWTSLVSAEVSSDSHVKGNYSGKIKPNADSHANGHIWQAVTLEKNTDYILKGKIKIISTAQDSTAALVIKSGTLDNPRNVDQDTIVSTTAEWQEAIIEFNSGDMTNFIVGMDRWAENANGALKNSSAYLDDVTLTKVGAEEPDETYDITWWDDFNGTSLDTTKWDYELGHIRGLEQQHYVRSDENVYVKDGKLTIKATDRPVDSQYNVGGRQVIYNSGSIRTHDNKQYLYGRFETKAKLPKGKGVFPAFWTLGSDFTLDGVINGAQGHGWPSCGEVDIMELIGDGSDGSARNRTVYQTLHYSSVEGGSADNGKYAGNGTAYTIPSGNFNDDYHIFGLNWTKGKMEWYVDDQIVRTVDYSDDQAAVDALDKPQYIQFNLAMGGAWPGEVGTNLAGTTYDVDYVYYGQTDQQKADAAEYYANAPKLNGTQNITMQQGDIPDLLANVSASEGYHVDYSIDDDSFFDNDAGNSSVHLVINSDANKDKLATLDPGEYTLYYTAIPDDLTVSPRKYARETVKLTVQERTFPTDFTLTGVYGETLSTIGLPENWTWEQPNTILNQYQNQFKVNYSQNGFTTSTTVSVKLVSADKTNLSELMKKAETYIQSETYTDDSISLLKNEVQKAQAIMNKTDATKEDVATAIQNLNTAIAQLEKKPNVEPPVTPPESNDDKYIINDGKEVTVQPGEAVSFRSNASIEKFKEVLLDGKVLDSQYYTVKEGSTIITLHPEFTKTLSEGQHTLIIVSTDGQATAKFGVEASTSNPVNPSKPNINDTSNNQNKPSTNQPQTGDSVQVTALFGLFMISGALGYFMSKKHKKI